MPREGRESELVLRFQVWPYGDEEERPGSSRFVWFLLGRFGTVQFVYTRDPLMALGLSSGSPFGDTPGWMPYDVGYHSPEPMFDGHEPIEDFGECDALSPHLRGSRCYYDGSSLQAMRFMSAALEGGGIPWTEDEDRSHEGHRLFEKSVRAYLATLYHQVFYEDYDGPHRAGRYLTWDQRRERMDAAMTTFRVQNGDKAMTEGLFQSIVETNFGPERRERPR